MYEKAVVEGLNDLPEANMKTKKSYRKFWTKKVWKTQEILKI